MSTVATKSSKSGKVAGAGDSNIGAAGRPPADVPRGGYPSPATPQKKIIPSPNIMTFAELCNPTPKQTEFLAAIDTKRYVLYGGAAGGGKALTLSTRIPSPLGWTTMGELQVGDLVFSEEGEPIPVIAVSEIFREKNYELTFSSGQRVVCGYRHEWITNTGSGLKCRTTQEIVDTLGLGHSIPVCEKEICIGNKVYRSKKFGAYFPHSHWIVGAKEVPEVDLRCIQVDSPTHQYLCTEGFIPTHNSYILRWGLVYKLLRWAQQGHKNVRVGLFCEDYPALKDRQLTKIETEFPPWLGTLKESAHEFRLADRFGGGIIACRNLDDVAKYASSEFAAIAVDELTKNRMGIFDQLRWRMRWPGIDDVVFMAATNPGGIGHQFCRQLWVDRIFPPELEKYADTFQFVQAKSADNPHLSGSYSEMLQTLPEAMRMAYAEGSWDIFEGMVFNEWSASKHIVRPFEIPDSWTRIRCMDWGFSKPYAIYWGAVDYDGVIWIYRELYGSQHNQPDIGTKETAREVAMRVRELEKGEKVHSGVADPACWTKMGTGPSVAEEFDLENIYWEKADNSRLAGKMQFHSRLRDGGIKFFSTCRHAIRTIPQLVYDKTRVEDVDTDQEDHCLVGDTLVMTTRGEVPIKDVVAGDVVLNRFGWFRVEKSWLTNDSAKIYRVDFSNGAEIRGTGNHKVWTANRGVVQLDALRYGDIMVASTDYIQEVSLWQTVWKQSCSMGSRIVDTLIQRVSRRKDTSFVQEQTKRKGSPASTVTRGSSIMEKFLLGITYTMALAVMPITALRILSAYNPEGICQDTPTSTCPEPNTWLGYDRLPPNGVGLKRVMTGTFNMAKMFLSRLWPTRCPKSASSAAKTMTYQELWRAALNSVATTVSPQPAGQEAQMLKQRIVNDVELNSRQINTSTFDSAPSRVRVVAVSAEVNRQPVYSLHVEHTHEYFASGLNVLNSYDSIRYMLMARPWTPRMVKSERETAEEEYNRKLDYKRKQMDAMNNSWGSSGGSSWMSG